jgi:hypothetical protein
MADYIVTTSPSEEEALQWTASQADPPQDAASYLDARVHDMLHSYEQQHGVQTAVAPVDDVTVAYVKGTPEQQQQVADILNVPPTKSS